MLMSDRASRFSTVFCCILRGMVAKSVPAVNEQRIIFIESIRISLFDDVVRLENILRKVSGGIIWN